MNNPWCNIPDTLSTIMGNNWDGDFGIEMELEWSKAHMTDTPELHTSNWRSEEEHSLRGGIEFITKSQLRYGSPEMQEAFAELGKHLKNHEGFKNSIRTSTHIHINALPFTLDQIYNTILNYYLFENLLVHNNGINRRGNLFCLRMCDANGLVEAIENSIVALKRSSEDIKSFDKVNRIKYLKGFMRGGGVNSFGFHMDYFKYGALNLASISNINTFEFRYMRSCNDPELTETKMNLSILYNLVHSLKQQAPSVVLYKLQNLPTMEFLRGFFTEDQIKFLYGEDVTDKLASEMLRVNLEEIVYLNKIYRSSVPPSLKKGFRWLQNDDSEVESSFFNDKQYVLEGSVDDQ